MCNVSTSRLLYFIFLSFYCCKYRNSFTTISILSKADKCPDLVTTSQVAVLRNDNKRTRYGSFVTTAIDSLHINGVSTR